MIRRNSCGEMKFDIIFESRSSSSHDIGPTNALYSECHMTKLLSQASNNKSLLQKVTKLRLMRSKNQKIKKTLFFPPTTLKYPP